MNNSTTNISESMECDALCEWAKNIPQIDKYLISIPNQAICYTNPGIRKKMSRQGVKKGIPDYFLAIPVGPYGGLWLEMKKRDLKGKKLRPEQQEWQDKLNEGGYKAVVAYGWEDALKEIALYIMEAETIPELKKYLGT